MNLPDPDATVDPVVLRAIRNLCPSEKSEFTSIEVSCNGRKVTLTAETRKRINARLRELEKK
jgi:hypothetical protein